MKQNSDEVARWAIRLTERAHADIEAAEHHFEDTAGEYIAEAWREGLESALATLAVFPQRFPLAAEHDFFPKPSASCYIAAPEAARLSMFCFSCGVPGWTHLSSASCVCVMPAARP